MELKTNSSIFCSVDSIMNNDTVQMKLSEYLLSIIVFFFSIKCDGQPQYSFKKILNLKTVNKTFVSTSDEDTTWRTYLGKITDSKQRPLYYVIKEFNKTKAAIKFYEVKIKQMLPKIICIRPDWCDVVIFARPNNR